MKIAIREADLDGDAAGLVAFLQGQLADHAGSARYDWLYRRNPFGPARAWIATDEAERIVGAAAAFPRPIVVDGAEVRGFNLGDFAIDPQYRALGPALRLQRALLDEVTSAGALAYDHPSAGMLAVYRWLKVEPAGQVVRYAKPLAVRGLIGAPGNTLLRLADSVGRPRSSATAAPLDGRFAGAAEGLAGRVVAACRVSALRSAAYLNWRYLDSPSRGHEVIAVAGKEACEGFAVVRRDGRHAVLRELVAERDSDAGHALLSHLVGTLREAGVETLSAPLLETSPLVPLLRRWGFHARESTPFVVVTDPTSPLRETATQGRHWMLTDGDRDV